MKRINVYTVIGKVSVDLTKTKGRSEGHKFEDDFRKSVPPSVYIKKLKLGGFHYKGGGNEADFLLYNYPKLYFLELKSHKGKSFPIDAIRKNQIDGLVINQHSIKGCVCGFLFNFRDYEETYFISIDDLTAYLEETDKKSIPLEFCRVYGIRIEQYKKRVRYRYDLSSIL